MVPTVVNQPSSACLSGSERRRPGWFLDMKYQTCFLKAVYFLGGHVLTSTSEDVPPTLREGPELQDYCFHGCDLSVAIHQLLIVYAYMLLWL